MDMTAVAAAGGLALLATLNVGLWTIRVALAAAGRRLAAALVSGVEALLFALVFGTVVSGLNDPLRIGAYACGVALGTLLGIVAGERLSTGQSVVTAVFDGVGWAQVTTLRDAGWPVTSSAADGVRGPVAVVRVVVDDLVLRRLRDDIDRLCPHAFVTVEPLRGVRPVALGDGMHAARSRSSPSLPRRTASVATSGQYGRSRHRARMLRRRVSQTL